MSRERNCMFCGTPISPPVRVGGRVKVPCTTCSPFIVTDTAFEDQFDPKKVERYLVSAALRWESLEHGTTPEVDTYRIEEISTNAPRYRPAEKADRLLIAIGMMSKRPGVVAQMNDAQRVPLSWAYDATEAVQYLAWLQQDGLAKPGHEGQILTKAGWQRYEELLTTGARAAARRAFVAMWFDDSMDGVWEYGLKPGIADAGYEPYRAKGQSPTGRIDAHIVAEIRACRFLVVEVTGERTAVYYEAGFAEGLGIPVIRACKKADESKMSFDTRQFPHILWNDPTDLRKQLAERIRAAIF
jgi:nucleoside 2-deoxyribosyltransferase